MPDPERRHVPCESCTLCCRVYVDIHLDPKVDDIASYETYLDKNGKPCLARNETNTACLYLGPTGCTIRDRAPKVCREYDCRWRLADRILEDSFPQGERPVLRRAKTLLDQADQAEVGQWLDDYRTSRKARNG